MKQSPLTKLKDIRYHILGATFVVVVIAIVAFVERTSILNARKIANSAFQRESEHLLSTMNKSFDNDLVFVQVLAQDNSLVNFFDDYDSDEVGNSEINDYLAGINTLHEGSTLYILDSDGLCIGSTDHSFLGNNYSYRPYFKDAIEKNHSFSVARGVTSNKLGFYFASSVVSDGEVLGLIVEKVDISEFFVEELKSESGTFYFMTLDGVVFYSNKDTDQFFWREPSQEVIAKIDGTKQFSLAELRSPKFSLLDSKFIKGSKSYFDDTNKEYYSFESQIGEDWHALRVVRLSDYDSVMEEVTPILTQSYVLSTIVTITTLVLLTMLFFFIKFYRSQFTVREELSKAEKTLKLLVERIPIGITRTTIDGSFTFLNTGAMEIFGFKDFNEAKRHKITDFYVNVENRRAFISLLKKGELVKDRIVEIFDMKKTKKMIRASYWINSDLKSLEMMFEDVTEAVRIEERFKSIALSISDCIWEIDRESKITFCSENVDSLMGYKVKDVVGRSISEFMKDEERANFLTSFNKAIKKKSEIKGFVSQFRKKSGDWIFLELNAAPIIDSRGILSGYRGSSKDLTPLLAQKEYLDLLTSAVEQSATTIVITDIDGNIEYVNSHFEELTGYKREEVIGKNPKILNSGYHDRSFYKNLWDTILSGKTYNGKIRNRKKDGTIFWEDTTITPIRSSGGAITHFIAVKEDVTKDLAIEEERTLYQQITRSIGDELYLIDKDGSFGFVNDSTVRNTGYSHKDFEKLKMQDFEVDYIKDLWMKRFESVGTGTDSEEFEITIFTKNRDRQVKALTIRHLDYKGKPYLLAVGRDVTRKKESEEIEKERVSEIQKLNELTAGREYKIIELQEKLEKLERLVEKYKRYFGK